MAVDSSEQCQDVYSISVFPDECPTNSQCTSKFAITNFLEALTPFKSHISLDPQQNYQDFITLPMEKTDEYFLCSVNGDIEKGDKQTPITSDENVNSLKAESLLTRVMHKDISFYIGGNLMRLIINHILMLLKFTSRDKSGTERKYKRSVSFNSRKIALLFSVLSSMGTMILIYLTLRVRQM